MEPYSFEGDWGGQLVATAIHTGHGLRPEVEQLMVLDEDTRPREEDPFTDRIAAMAPARVTVHRSRFEVDLNRVRDKAVYRTPDDAWGLEVWRDGTLPDDVVGGSLEVYDSFYEQLAERLDEVAARGPFIVLDVHSYNHRRRGPAAPEEPVLENPEINLGTGTVDDRRFRGVEDAFRLAMVAQHFDIRENVKFEGQALAWWAHGRYPGVGCVLAIEFKKKFMDEWTGDPDAERIELLRQALANSYGPLLEALPR